MRLPSTERMVDGHRPEAYDVDTNQRLPIIYREEYNIKFCGIEKLHPFDSGKWGRVFHFLKEEGMLSDDNVIQPCEAHEKDLLFVHTRQYLNSLKWSINVAKITEVPPVAVLPNFLVQRSVLRPLRFQTSGTILAGKLAVERGWAINIGGGFHHCSANHGGGFCAYADITLCIKYLFDQVPKIRKAMIIDLDAHQGNGHERDFLNDNDVYIMDVYNRQIYPRDGYAKGAIKRRVELVNFTSDDVYLEKVERNVKLSLEEFTPDVILFNAGTDILEGDPLGLLSITPKGIIKRDEIVFTVAREHGIPIVMVTSGGYQRQTSSIIADSILNLQSKALLSVQHTDSSPASTSNGAISCASRL